MDATALLDAAVEQFAITGARRTSADDIARRAGVNRATLYRKLGTKEQILQAAIVQETSKVLATIEAAVGPVPSPGTPGFKPSTYVLNLFTVTVAAARDNRLRQQLTITDPEDALVALTAGAHDVLNLGADLVETKIRQLRAYTGNRRRNDIRPAAVTLARLTHSLILTPDAEPILTTPKQHRQYVDAVIVPMVLGPTP